jgi:nucleotide-binding universal stress UspA family protein
VVAGVGPGRPPARLVRTAAAEARLRGAELRLVHAWDRHPGEATSHALRHAAADVADLLGRRAGPGGVPLTVALPREPAPARCLVAEAADADLIVVGGAPDGHGSVAGTVPRAVLAGATCPVLLVPGSR